MIQIYEGVLYRENFKKSPFRKIIEKLFESGEKCENEGYILIEGFFKLIMNSLYAVQTRKDISEFYKCKSEYCMQAEYDDNVLQACKLPMEIVL